MNQKKLAIIVTKGSLDWAYPPFILASTAAALDYEVQMFFTFYGLSLLKKNLDLQITSIGNPAIPMPFPLPVVLQTLPGMQAMTTHMMKRKMKSKGVASIETLRDLCHEAGVVFIGCQMTVDLFDYPTSEFIDGIVYGGAATYFAFAGSADVNLFV